VSLEGARSFGLARLVRARDEPGPSVRAKEVRASERATSRQTNESGPSASATARRARIGTKEGAGISYFMGTRKLAACSLARP
jgi:hypothetical protein